MEALSSMAADKLFQCMKKQSLNGDVRKHVSGRILSGLLGLAALVETAVSCTFLALSCGAEAIGAPKKWHKNLEGWANSATSACVACFEVFSGEISTSTHWRILLPKVDTLGKLPR